MYIKKITISGFRSYRDTNVVDELSAGHNVIVGGNGCGKSNLLNAIQFVLSDEFKGLAANQRQQLINESHKQRLLMAFVEIVVDNTDRRIPLDANDVILRRQIGLKKDQYFLNNKIVNYSDIVNMLEAAGFSRSNPYYIVKQGKVNEMAVASDEYRLQVMREVAGTRIYDARKAEAMKLLTESQQRSEQMEDCFNSMDERLNALENESNDLKHFLKWDKRRRLVEYTIANKESESIKNSVAKYQIQYQQERDQLELKQNSLQDIQQKMKLCEKKIKVIVGVIDEYTKDMTNISEFINDLNEQKERIAFSVKDFNDSVNQTKNNELKTKQELKSVIKRIKDSRNMLKSVSQKYDQLKKDENEVVAKLKAKQSRRVQIYDKLKRKESFRTVEDRNKWIESELSKVYKEIETNEQRVKDLKREEEELRTRRIKLEKEKKRFTDEENELIKKMENKKKLLCETNKFIKIMENKRFELWEVENQLKQKEFAISDDKQKIEKKFERFWGTAATIGRQSVNEVLKMFELMATRSASDRKRLQPIIDGYLGQVIDCFTFDAAVTKALDVSAKGKLFHHIVENDKIATQIMKELNTRKMPGEFTFIALNQLNFKPVRYPEFGNNARPLTTLLRYDTKYQKVLRFLFDRTLLCRDLETCTLYARSADLDCVTLEGDLVSRKGLMSGGHVRDETRIDVYNKIKAIAAALDSISNEIKDCLKEKEDNELLLGNNVDQMTGLDVDQNKTNKRLADLKVAKNVHHQELVDLNTKYESVIRSLSSLESILPAMITNRDSYEAELELGLDSQLTTNEQKELKAIVQEIESLSNQHKELCDKRCQFATEKTRLEVELDENLEKQKNELEFNIISAKIAENETLFETESADLEMISKKINGLRQQLDEKYTKMDELVRQKSEQIEMLDNIRLAEEKQLNLMNIDAKHMRKIAVKMETIERKNGEYVRKLKQMGTIPNECDVDYENMRIDDLYRELQKCNKKISRLTNVNQKALDQLNEGKEKARILNAEKQAIDLGYHSIEKLIESLEHQKYEAIQVTYKSVSKHFVDIFKRLVPEGTAFIDMIYADTNGTNSVASQDSQESQSSGAISGIGLLTPILNKIDNFVGVKIRVAFTGTAIVKEMHQLSGGQKSIVALAFIFAIQRCDPAPFYLFDEVDQALDPIYRKALSVIIREMSRTSQFITTTFRPELLDCANKVFGVKFRNRISHIGSITMELAKEFIEESDESMDRSRRDQSSRKSVRFDTSADKSV
ncbi:structural maintenance of chromosomes protein 3-like [Oppia nitens]|uniref:structural maintenance of chromosomes protein 3-like n=1 Tax=Oppia nitens TaxID=1686743 RepID=UPI0023D9FF3F|nr:structural maintenance of chromosomes protein 3-like [Oppia nitens]